MARGIMANADRDVLRRIEAFDESHGGPDAAVVEDKFWLLFPDGARRQIYLDFACPLLEPPEDDQLYLAQLKARYAEVKLQYARNEFNEAKQALRMQAAGAAASLHDNTPTPPPTTEEIAKLKALQKIVVQRQAEYEAAGKAVEDAKPRWQKERDTRAAEALPAITETQRTIESIEI